MTDTQILVKSESWKIKVILSLGGLIALVILALMFQIQFGIVILLIGSATSVRMLVWARHQYKLSGYEQRRLEAETRKLEAEAVRAKAESYFVETNTGVFVLDGIVINAFYPAVSASKTLADSPLLLPASTEVKSYRKLLDVDFIHLLVVGPSGSGKTTVLCHLIDNAPSNTLIYALDPHAQFNEWPGRVNQVIGQGRDYGAINTKLDYLISVMDGRYNGIEPTSQRILIVADEWLGILDKCESAKDFFNTIGSEARKVNMSLVISSISATVDDLDVSAAIRDNLAQLTLSRTLQAQNLGEIKWSRADKELVELPGRYVYRQPVLPAKVEDFEELPILDSGPVFTPTLDELKIYELHLQGKSPFAIHRELYPDRSYGGIQASEIKAVLKKFNVNL